MIDTLQRLYGMLSILSIPTCAHDFMVVVFKAFFGDLISNSPDGSIKKTFTD